MIIRRSIIDRFRQRRFTMKINPESAGHIKGKPKRSRWCFRKLGFQLVIFMVSLVVFGVIGEINSSILQAHFLSNLSEKMTYELVAGESNSRILAPQGPYDTRLGYTSLPDFTQKLKANRFDVIWQAQPSETMIKLVDKGLYPIYPEKSQAGLKILDSQDRSIFSQYHPKRIIGSFDDIPPIVVEFLLFIENRNLLDDDRPFANPAIDWLRLGNAALEQGKKLVYQNGSG
ncbi:MAG: transglycosylase domain-containing protein, partial [Desulfobacterales bacterium]